MILDHHHLHPPTRDSPFRHPLRVLSLSRKTLVVLAATSLSLLFLLVASSQRMGGGWSAFDEAYFHRDHQQQQQQQHPQHSGPTINASDPAYAKPDHSRHCDGVLPDTSNIMVVMKTGASEAYARIPTQLLTVLRCLPDFLLFSDMDQEMPGGYRIHDSLSTVLPETMLDNKDFDLYRRQRACVVDQEACNKLGNPAKEGWDLDKYKNIHMAEKTWAMRPGHDWYLFIDADTYLLLPSLVMWLKTLDPAKKLYLGSVALVSGFPFAHGGSGYVVSRAAMEEFAGGNPGVANAWDMRAKKECCGDYVFAMAMKETIGLDVQNVWPTVNGEKPSTLPFGPWSWCHPIVTMHHLNSEEINMFHEFEKSRYAAPTHPTSPEDYNAHLEAQQSPILHRDIYYRYLAPLLVSSRPDWDNRANDRYYLDLNNSVTAVGHSWDEGTTKKMKSEAVDNTWSEEERRAHLSAEDCAAACASLGADECLSWRYQPGNCMISRGFSLGKPVRADVDGGRMASGWAVDSIKRWVEEQGDCKGVWKWPKVKG